MKKKTIIALVLSAVFVFVAVAVNWKYSLLGNLFSQAETPIDPSVEAGASVDEDTYFDNARYTRSQSREEALSLLNEIINDEAVDETVRANAYNEVVAYAKITEGEASLENVLKAKGFEECIVFLTSDTATVVVGTESLTDQQSAQIFDAVLAQTGFESGSVKIVTYP
ncbi:MAG: SpoIIIAH-like family protein [Clostridia bacterium]|nr:SpoIIIAH-like family protein [Clostridia bacterium]